MNFTEYDKKMDEYVYRLKIEGAWHTWDSVEGFDIVIEEAA